MSELSLSTKNYTYNVRLRVIITGLILVIVNSYWISMNDFLKGLNHTYMSLFSNAIFTLFGLILINLLIRKFSPKSAFTESDNLVIYVMIVAVSTLSGHRMTRFLGPIAHPFKFATVENEWRDLFWRYIPDWFTPRDMRVLDPFFSGDSSLFNLNLVLAWLVPTLYWSGFLFALYAMLICLNVIIRKQLTDYERLTYPITWMPLEMSRDGSSFLKNKLMWIGFSIAASISFLNGLRAFHPSLPYIPVGWRVIEFPDKPWGYMGQTRISFQPFVIGLSFFMPLDLSFSAWFFYLSKKIVQLLVGTTTGLRNLHFIEQSMGAWIGLGILTLWLARNHLKQIFLQVFMAQNIIDESKEPMNYRTAIWGIVLALIFFLFFSYKSGLSSWIILLFLAIYCFIGIGVTKIRSGLGLAVHEMLMIDPSRAITETLGTRIIGPRNLTILSFFYGLTRDQAAHPMPNQLEGFRIGEQSKTNIRKLLSIVIIALLVGIPINFIIYLHLSYHYGAGNWSEVAHMGRESFTNRLQVWLTSPTPHDYSTMAFMGIGFGITSLLLAMKMRFLWWPLHPIGFVLGVSPAEMVYIWVPVFISWLLKLTILKYGGLKTYRKAIPFFVGLILGDYTMGGIWSIVNATFNIATYNMGWHPVSWWE